MAGCNGGNTVLGFAPAQAGASIPRSRLVNRGPGLRRDENLSVGTDGLLHAVLEVGGVVG